MSEKDACGGDGADQGDAGIVEVYTQDYSFREYNGAASAVYVWYSEDL